MAAAREAWAAVVEALPPGGWTRRSVGDVRRYLRRFLAALDARGEELAYARRLADVGIAATGDFWIVHPPGTAGARRDGAPAAVAVASRDDDDATPAAEATLLFPFRVTEAVADGAGRLDFGAAAWLLDTLSGAHAGALLGTPAHVSLQLHFTCPAGVAWPAVGATAAVRSRCVDLGGRVFFIEAAVVAPPEDSAAAAMAGAARWPACVAAQHAKAMLAAARPSRL